MLISLLWKGTLVGRASEKGQASVQGQGAFCVDSMPKIRQGPWNFTLSRPQSYPMFAVFALISRFSMPTSHRLHAGTLQILKPMKKIFSVKPIKCSLAWGMIPQERWLQRPLWMRKIELRNYWKSEPVLGDDEKDAGSELLGVKSSLLLKVLTKFQLMLVCSRSHICTIYKGSAFSEGIFWKVLIVCQCPCLWRKMRCSSLYLQKPCNTGLEITNGQVPATLSAQTWFCSDKTQFWPVICSHWKDWHNVMIL